MLLLFLIVEAAVHQAPVLIVDNGSRRAESVRALRWTADQLGGILDRREVFPVSVQWSDSIPAKKLGGIPANLLREKVLELNGRGYPSLVVVPLFLGPSSSFQNAITQCVADLDAISSSLELRVGSCLVDRAQPEDDRIARTLANLIEGVGRANALSGPLKVIVCDHGTPLVEVHQVRTRLTAEVRELLGERAAMVAAASMERREGAAYDFNEPLLESLLATPPFDNGDVIVAMAFLLPGKHAGEGGDVAQMIQRACGRSPNLRVYTTPLLASQPLVHDVLRDRVLQADELPVRLRSQRHK